VNSQSLFNKQKTDEYRLGRCIQDKLPNGSDLITEIIDLCNYCSIKKGRFCAIGRVQTATIGVYDQSQEVYVTHLEEQATEVLFCRGTIDTRNEESPVIAKILLADQQGQLTGGHLFSGTIIQEIQIDLQEMIEFE